MTQARLIRFSGWGFVLAALCLLSTFLAVPEDIRPLSFLGAIVLVTLGLVGLRARYDERAGTAAKLALGAGIGGGLAGVVSNFLMLFGYEDGRSLMNLSMAVMFGGLFAFGSVAVRHRPLPRGNGLPALAGVWWPLIVIVSNVYPLATGQAGPKVPAWLSFSIFAVMSLSLAGLGYVLQANAPPGPAADQAS